MPVASSAWQKSIRKPTEPLHRRERAGPVSSCRCHGSPIARSRGTANTRHPRERSYAAPRPARNGLRRHVLAGAFTRSRTASGPSCPPGSRSRASSAYTGRFRPRHSRGSRRSARWRMSASSLTRCASWERTVVAGIHAVCTDPEARGQDQCQQRSKSSRDDLAVPCSRVSTEAPRDACKSIAVRRIDRNFATSSTWVAAPHLGCLRHRMLE